MAYPSLQDNRERKGLQARRATDQNAGYAWSAELHQSCVGARCTLVDPLQVFFMLLLAHAHPVGWQAVGHGRGSALRKCSDHRVAFSATRKKWDTDFSDYVQRLPSSLSRASAPVLVDVSVVSAVSPQLVTSYGECTALLLREIADTTKGDEIALGIYLLEGGESSERVLAALEEAGSRGVCVDFGLDVSYVSMISRIIERTDTLIPRVAKLAQTQPQWCSCSWGSKPDHSKFALFARKGSDRGDSAILGGINFGDRFKTWDDYAVRLPSPYAEDLRRSLRCSSRTAPVFAVGSLDEPPTVVAARVIAIASPLVALATVIFFSASIATLTVAAPISAVTSDPGFSYTAIAATAVSGLVAFILGTGFATACDGATFSVARELSGFARSLVYDRSMLGDSLAVLRRLYTGAASEASTEQTPVGEWRYLPPSPLPADPMVQFIANRREQRRYEIEATFRALFSDQHLQHYRVVMAYLGHRWGVELIECALKRGARVELLLPARSNVYACENLKAAQTLIDGQWPSLRLYLSPTMVHAKAMLARDSTGGSPVAFLGSANLVRGSMNLPVHCGLLPYDELNVLIRESGFCNDLDASMNTLFERAREVVPGEDLLTTSEWYTERRAQWEELWQ